ncbi:sulfatase [Prosthecobacter fluviatilis]|uniref:Sulfatase n=1 Tax=Prosthecobacter fluviatilis TaxID=445931 RepID=A0ABW0KQK8_9BACT
MSLPRLLACLLLCISNAAAAPNVILFIADDVSYDDLGCYGNAAARTPNIDRLAAKGRRFDEAILVASSCSPSRSSVITGRYPHNNGRASELHQPIAAHLPWFPRLLREAGWYTALVGKHHMTSDKPAAGEQPQPEPFDLVDAGNEPGNKGGHATWVKTVQQRPKDKPFFFWFASLDAHRAWDADKDWKADLYGPKHDPAKVIVPPYLNDDAATRDDLASYYNEITRWDYFIGLVVTELEKEGTLDDTLIMIMADNGRPFPRAKTRLHDSGMKTPFIAHWPKGIAKAGTPTQSLISSIDIAPTVLTLAGVAVPPTMQGLSFAPVLADPAATPRKYAFSEHNWHDYEAHGRSVRSEGFLYIVNSRPDLAWQGPADSVHSPSFQSLRAVRDAGKLTPPQADVFLSPRPTVELYRTDADPLQLQNLADDANYASVKARLAKAMTEWTTATGDSAPASLSKDSFDRETGNKLKLKEADYRGTPAGWDKDAAHINAPGPR